MSKCNCDTQREIKDRLCVFAKVLEGHGIDFNLEAQRFLPQDKDKKNMLLDEYAYACELLINCGESPIEIIEVNAQKTPQEPTKTDTCKGCMQKHSRLDKLPWEGGDVCANWK